MWDFPSVSAPTLAHVDSLLLGIIEYNFIHLPQDLMTRTGGLKEVMGGINGGIKRLIKLLTMKYYYHCFINSPKVHIPHLSFGSTDYCLFVVVVVIGRSVTLILFMLVRRFFFHLLLMFVWCFILFLSSLWFLSCFSVHTVQFHPSPPKKKKTNKKKKTIPFSACTVFVLGFIQF